MTFSLPCLLKIHCFLSWVQGYGSFLLRDLPFDAIQFCLYEQLRMGYKLAVSWFCIYASTSSILIKFDNPYSGAELEYNSALLSFVQLSKLKLKHQYTRNISSIYSIFFMHWTGTAQSHSAFHYKRIYITCPNDYIYKLFFLFINLQRLVFTFIFLEKRHTFFLCRPKGTLKIPRMQWLVPLQVITCVRLFPISMVSSLSTGTLISAEILTK